MPRGFRILHLADSHVGAQLPARPRSHRRRRGDDIIAAYRRVLSLAETHDADLVIHAGDVFDVPNPSHSALAAAAEPLLRLAAGGRAVVIVPGNHERSALPSSLLLAHPKIHVAGGPLTLEFDMRGTRVCVAALPCIRRQAARLFEDAVQATGWSRSRADVKILAVHQTFESATCGPAGYRFRSGDDVIERSAIPGAFGYVAAGHIHRHQVLYAREGEGPPIVYAGSPDRITLAERDEPKGAILIESDGSGLTHRFIEHPVRPMRVVPLNLSGLSRGRILDEIARQAQALPPECIAAFRLSGETSRATMRGLRLSQTVRALRPDVDFTLSVQALEYVPERQIERASPAATRRGFRDFEFDRAAGNPEVTGGRCPPAARCDGLATWNGDAPAVADEVELLREASAPLSIEMIGSAPAGPGTYILLDRRRRVLYVGKANQIRARLRSHVSAKSDAAHFAGWTRQIAAFRVRPAQSELEALLAEAVLIRDLRPPFNRQMRLWSRYCYLLPSAGAWSECALCKDPRDEDECIGPIRSRSGARLVLDAANDFFRLAACPTGDAPRVRVGRSFRVLSRGFQPKMRLSNHSSNLKTINPNGKDPAAFSSANLCDRYYRGVCSGPCAARIDPRDYTESIRQRDRLLSGLDDGPLFKIEQEIEAIAASRDSRLPSRANVHQPARADRETLYQDLPELSEAQRVALARIRVLRAAFDFAALVRMAAGLRGGVLLLPGAGDGAVGILLGDERVGIHSLPPHARSRPETIDSLQAHAQACDPRPRHWLAKGVADAYLLAAKHMALGTDGCRFFSREALLGGDCEWNLQVKSNRFSASEFAT